MCAILMQVTIFTFNQKAANKKGTFTTSGHPMRPVEMVKVQEQKTLQKRNERYDDYGF